VGVFAINQLDAERLRAGMAELAFREPGRASRVRQRADASVARLTVAFPGDPLTGTLGEGGEDRERFENFADDELCPALDPATGTCDLYSSRPMTCRIFGPPVRSQGGLGVCELCYHGATAEEIAACEMVPDPEDIESRLVDDLERTTGLSGKTIVAFALVR
jgi:Fe-S-cluster containining protein